MIKNKWVKFFIGVAILIGLMLISEIIGQGF